MGDMTNVFIIVVLQFFLFDLIFFTKLQVRSVTFVRGNKRERGFSQADEQWKGTEEQRSSTD